MKIRLYLVDGSHVIHLQKYWQNKVQQAVNAKEFLSPGNNVHFFTPKGILM